MEGNPRGNNEEDAGELWKERKKEKKVRRFWPLFFCAIMTISVVSMSKSSEKIFAETPPTKVARNDNSFYVQQVQYVLHSFGYTVELNGIFGPRTERAVKHFQRANGLLPDGIVGPKTLKALGLVFGDIVVAPPVPVATPAPNPTPTTHSKHPDADQWYDLAMSVGWQDSQWPVLACIIHRESRGQPNAKNPYSSAMGLLQILGRYFPGVNLYDPRTNLATGLHLYQLRGWQPWTLPGHQCY